MTSNLIDRLSKLKAPDREVDALIIKHLGLEDECPFWLQRLTRLSPMRLTASVDAAVALAKKMMPKMSISFSDEYGVGTARIGCFERVQASTPAIALCIAILRAKEASKL